MDTGLKEKSNEAATPIETLEDAYQFLQDLLVYLKKDSSLVKHENILDNVLNLLKKLPPFSVRENLSA